MKTILTIVYGIICIAFISISHFLWIDKTTALQAEEKNSTQKNAEVSNVKQNPIDSLLPLTKNWPEAGAENFKKAVENNEKFTIVIAGSDALGGETGWAMTTKAKLLEAYGEEHISVEVREYDTNSEQFTSQNKHLELADLKADLLLFEPFILKNNGEVELVNTLANLTTTIEAVKASNPECVIIVQPANPIYKAKIYPTQVAQLKAYADEFKLTFLDHWGIWPDPNTEAIKEYITPEHSFPNEQGHEVWSQFVNAYFINQE
ncbi:SGNH/GDSL hydrolase family protein [Bacillus marasmi]|uniref:SGNH/GDSL hydrolase family protein n=1 Tax=Bacillus marasmi TaxID=1926279 RepID=UPI0011C84750|nr:SGNH/GDSL hydrolase family protein [Bacillus marasmi]